MDSLTDVNSRIQALENLVLHPDQKQLFERTAYIKTRYFPELSGLWVYLGVMGKLEKKQNVFASVDVENCVLRFNVEKYITNVTIFHELMHIVNWRNEASPRTEEFNSISAIARMPPNMVDEDNIPYIASTTRIKCAELPGICSKALTERVKGNRKYIKWLQEELRRYK